MRISFYFIIIFMLSVNDVFSQLYPAEAVALSTTRIVCFKDSIIGGKTKRYTEIGTGFYFYFSRGADTIPVIVTNTHVIDNCQHGYLRFKLYPYNSGGESENIMEIKIDDFDSKWIRHPSEDLAILPLDLILKEIYKLHKNGARIFYYGEQYIPSESELNELSGIEDVIMVGYPKGLFDEINDLPIVRRGLTATPVYLNYKNQKRFLIDIPIYPGSSGSPVLLYNLGSYPVKDGTLMVSPRLKLLGIVVQSSMYTAVGKTVPQDSFPSLEVKTMLPFNVAVVIKASRLLDFNSLLWNK